MKNIGIRFRLAAIVFFQMFLGGAVLSGMCFAIPFFENVTEITVHAAAFAAITVSTLVGIFRAIIILVQTSHKAGDFIEHGARVGNGESEEGKNVPSDGPSTEEK
jgi:ABC-type glycerol-3-phosphate transport system permease component